jgi:putative tryptophan/tyrosine transport system substrate-binding protein
VRRRDVIGLGTAVACAWPFLARAQQPGRRARIGLFAGATIPVMAPAYRAFLDELRKLGFIEGQNLTVDLRESDLGLDRLTAEATEMVRSNVDVIVALGSEVPLKAAVMASRSVPIVFMANNYDPIALGYVKSLASPGGNATGVILQQTELAEKQVELITHAFPDRTRLALLWDYVSADQFEAAERRAKLLRLDVHSRKMENPPYDIDAAFRGFADSGADVLLLLSSQFFSPPRDRILELAIRQRLPAMFIFRAWAEAGGLLSYGPDSAAMYRQGGTFVSKVLKGAKPADLPVEQPTKYEMVVNLKTAKAMGIELPTVILARADTVIE